MLPVGIQLYTIRDFMEKDFYGSIKKIADIGYKGVEFAGLFGNNPKEIRTFIDDAGLICHSSHDPFPNKDNVNELIDNLSVLGGVYSISGVGPDAVNTEDKAKETIEAFALACDLFKNADIKFGVHNHWWEFYYNVDGMSFFDALIKAVPDIYSELDIFWATLGGADPVEVIKKHPDNIALIHSKDGKCELPWDPKDPIIMVANGDGNIDIKGSVEAGEARNVKWNVVELDFTDGDMWTAVEKSYKYLTDSGLCIGNK